MKQAALMALIVASVLSLVACSYPEYRASDNKVLCDPKLKEAYFIQPGAGAVSYVQRNQNLDNLCKNPLGAETQK